MKPETLRALYKASAAIKTAISAVSQYKPSASVNAETDKPDVISMDVPLFIRLLEFAREDAAGDADLHDLAERAIVMSKDGKGLSMDDYEGLVPSAPEAGAADSEG